MQFPTLGFAIFFTLVLSLAWLARGHRIWRNLILLAASYWFYAALDWRFVVILIASSLTFYGAGELIARASSASRARGWLAAGIAFNLLLLAVFKYYNFFIDSLAGLAEMLGLSQHLLVLEILFPVGISFYVFQGISYLLDLSGQRGVRAGSLLDFLLYMTLFPQLLAGPICRSRELLPQIMVDPPRACPDVTRAAVLILSGLLKKAVLAHYIDVHLVGNIFSGPENFTAPALWVGMLGYTLLIYWDFSGYTDLARGLGLLLGFEIPENFDHPYVATDISDFWRRWHMTLSFWLRDYLFLPWANRWAKGFRRFLGRSQSALWGSQLSLLATFVICGLWHGAAWTFVLWGLYHGVLLFIHHGLRNGVKLRWKGGWWGRLGTLVLVAFGWVLFNAGGFDNCWIYLTRMFSFQATGDGFELLVLPVIVLGFAIHVYGPGLRRLYTTLSERLPWGWRPVLWFASGMVLLALKPSGIAPYIYFGF
ncbi:MBOAT family protein [bacterium]|nr:MBOAT family protein [bacterium]